MYPQPPQGNPAAPGPAAPGPAAQQPQAQQPMPPEQEQSGLRQVADIGFNQDVQNILLSRIQALQPQEAQILDSVISPQSVAVFVKILPELQPLFDMMSGGGGGQAPAIGGPQQPGQPPAAPPQPGPAMAQAQQPSEAEDGGAEDDEEEEGEENPLVRDRTASRGLMG